MIFKTFGFIIFFVFVILLILIIYVGNFFFRLIRNFFCFIKQDKSNTYNKEYTTGGQQRSAGPTISGQPKPRNSEFDKNEGEYVDFEEIS